MGAMGGLFLDAHMDGRLLDDPLSMDSSSLSVICQSMQVNYIYSLQFFLGVEENWVMGNGYSTDDDFCFLVCFRSYDPIRLECLRERCLCAAMVREWT